MALDFGFASSSCLSHFRYRCHWDLNPSFGQRLSCILRMEADRRQKEKEKGNRSSSVMSKKKLRKFEDRVKALLRLVSSLMSKNRNL